MLHGAQTFDKADSARTRAITASHPIRRAEAQPVQPRAVGTAMLHVAGDASGQTRLRDLRTSGAMKLVFPRQTDHVEAVIVNTAGGVTGGDALSVAATAEDGARLTLTTQAAERAYRAQPGQTGQVTTRLTVASGAQLFWLPQELILFEGCALTRRLDIDLAEDAALLMVEPVVLGRTAMKESLHDIAFRDRIAIRRDGRPLYIDGTDLVGDAMRHLSRRAIGAGAGAYASLVLVSPDAGQHLSSIRADLPATAGASLIAPDSLAMRLLAADGFALRASLLPLLDRLTGGALPRSWRL